MWRSMSRLAHQIEEVLARFDGLSKPPALIGGLALAAHRVVRATRDVDFLVLAEDADPMHALLLDLGYRCVHRSEDAANYLRGSDGFDLLYARRPIARQLLQQATVRTTPFGTLRVVGAEGLIGFKLQALCNDPGRLRDLDDIRQLLRTNRENLDLAEVRGYFSLFDRESLLDDLLADID